MRNLIPSGFVKGLWAFPLCFLCACATSETATRGVDVQGPKVVQAKDGTPSKPGEPQVNSRAKLLFEDAVKAFDAQKKAKTYDYPQLERKFRAALEADPSLGEAEYNLGVLAERQGKKDAAVEHYESALRAKPTLKQAAENLAVLAQNKGNVQAARNTYEEILQNYPDDASSRARLAELYRQSGDGDGALSLARQALMREPRTLPAYKVMMLTYLERKQPQMAKLVALRALKIDESDPELYHTVGLVLLAEGEPERARSQFKKAVEVNPNYQPSHVVLAKMALETEDYGGAEQHLRAILQTGGKSAEVFLNLGVAYKGMGQFDKALQAYDEAEKLNPDLAGIYLNRGIILHRHKQAPERGLDLYQKYIALAGGEASLAGDASVFKLIDDAKGAINAKEEERRTLEEAARMEREEKERQKLEKGQDGKGAEQPEGKGAKAEGGKADGDKAANTHKEEEPKGKPQGTTGGAVQPASSTNKPAPKPAPKPAAKPPPEEGEPASDEPQDAL